MSFENITDVPGVKVGNCEDLDALTGCTVILTENGATGGVDVRGSAPGTRETDALDPINAIQVVHGICLSGGSAFGLAAASGVMEYLEEKQIGVDVGVAKVPIVPSAVLFDLDIGDSATRPDAIMGYRAASKANVGAFRQGNTGAGCGATVGKVAGSKHAMKSGLGSSSVPGSNGLVVGAIVAVNAVGDIHDPNDHTILAGARNYETGEFIDSVDYVKKNVDLHDLLGKNTTIGVVAMNAKLTKSEAKKIAAITQNALARLIFPVHTMYDGDTIFVLGTGTKSYPLDYLSILAAESMEKAILNAVKSAEAVHSIASYSSIYQQKRG